MKTILASIDFSEVTPRVLELAANLARATGARLRMLHVVPPEPDFVGMEVGPAHERQWMAKDIRAARDEARSLAARIDGVEVDEHVVQGSILDTILEQASEHDVDLIVLGSHGHGALFRALVGSTSEGVLRKAGRPVLVVPADAAEPRD